MAGEEVLRNSSEKLNIGIVNFDKSTENGQLRENGFRDTVLQDERVDITASINVKSTVLMPEKERKKCFRRIRRSM